MKRKRKKHELAYWKRMLPVFCLLFFSFNLFAQAKTITGVVSDEQNDERLTGVNVVVKGTTIGTITDIDGAFTLDIKEADAVLVFSYLGYETLELRVPASGTMYVKIKESLTDLDEVVVVGYGTQKKVNLTGSVSIMKNEDLARRPVMRATSALQGLAAGVSVVQNSGQPGSDGATIRIRGVGTLNNSEALVLIDGIQGSLDGVDPNDIESISILKDAASSAIYGSRAANGVILVTTKQSAQEKITTTYNGFVGVQRFTDTPEFVDGYTYMKGMNEAYKNLSMTPLYTESYLNSYLRYKDIDPDTYPDTDWQKEVYTGSGLTQKHHISVSGGKRISTLASIAYQDQKGLIENFRSQRYSLRLNMKMDIRKNVQAALLFEGRHSLIDAPTSASSIKSNVNRIPPIYPSVLSDGRWGVGWNGGNPTAQIQEGGNTANEYNYIKSTFQLNYQPIKGADVELSFTPKFNDNFRKAFSSSIQTFNPGIEVPAYTSPAVSSLRVSDFRTKENTLRLLGRYEKSLGNHSLGGMAGYEQIIYRYDEFSARREGFPLSYYQELDAGSSEVWSNSGTAEEWALLSYFGRLNYGYKDRYLLEANVRVDGSSRFAKGNRWGTFPSFSAAWRISEEAFMEDIDWLTNLKLRASWGELGNQEIGTYPAYASMALGPSFIFGDKVADGAVQKAYANENISWETSQTTDFGVDASFLKNKLNISFDYYIRNTYDILLKLPITDITGMSEPYQNAGQVENKGWDLEISHNNKVGDFSYQIGFNLSDVHNKVIDLKGAGPIRSGYNLIEEGYPINSIYGYQALGIFQSDDQINSSPLQSFGSYAPGDIIYANINDDENDNIVDQYDRTAIGNQIPRFNYGFNFSAQYKDFDANIFLQGVGKKDVIFTGDAVWALYNAGKMQKWHTDYWTEDNPNAAYPRLIAASGHNNFQNSTFWMYSAAYLRIKTLQFGYTLPKKVVDKANIDKLRFFVTGDNVFTFDRMPPGWDPERPSGDAEIYPIAGTFLFGVELKF